MTQPGDRSGADLYLRQAIKHLHLDVPEDTVGRVIRFWNEFAGEPQDPPASITGAVFPTILDELVIVKDIQFTALCEHHLLPFYGHAAIGYIPNGKLLGLSKFSRVLNWYTRWPTLQEQITYNVVEHLMTVLEPKGVMVILQDVKHTCMNMRGVKDPEANTTTSAVRGVFRESANARQEFLSLIK